MCSTLTNGLDVVNAASTLRLQVLCPSPTIIHQADRERRRVVAEQSASRLGGDDYQHLYSWFELLRLLDPESPYESAVVEHPQAEATDDITFHPRKGSQAPA